MYRAQWSGGNGGYPWGSRNLSVVTAWLATISARLVRLRVGHLTGHDLRKIEKRLRASLKLRVPSHTARYRRTISSFAQICSISPWYAMRPLSMM